HVTYVNVGDGPDDIEINPAGTQARITNSLANTVTVMLLEGNEPPIIAPTLGDPDRATGTITGSLNATDRDNDTLSYTVSRQATRGTASIDPNTGAFTYTPDADARDAAAGGALTDIFDLTVDDGHGASVTRTLMVDILAATPNSAPTSAPTVEVPQ